jgi:sulfur-carrier protein
MRLQIVYFARVREAVGVDSETFDVDAGTSITVFLDLMSARSERHAAAFMDRDKLRFALDQNMVQADALLDNAKELAIFPPVTGG